MREQSLRVVMLSVLIAIGIVTLEACGDGDHGEPSATPTVVMTPQGTTLQQLPGVYDVTGGVVGRAPIGIIDVRDAGTEPINIRLQFEPASRIDITGQFSGGTVAGHGTGVVGGDTSVAATVQLAGARDGSMLTLSGTIRVGEGDSTAITLTRISDSSAARFSGVYGAAFAESPSGCQCHSRTTIQLEIGSDGTGSLTRRAEDRSDDGVLLGQVEAGKCYISSTARLLCDVRYLFSSGESMPLILTGQFDVPDPSHVIGSAGSGIVYASVWDAARQ